MIDVSTGDAKLSALGSGAQSAQPGAQREIHVLVADDDPNSEQILRWLFRDLGCAVDFVRDGSAVMKALERTHYDLVFLDVLMPVLDGVETARRIAADLPPEQRPYLCVLTAGVAPNIRQLCVDAGMTEVLFKPVRRQMLVDIIERVRQLM